MHDNKKALPTRQDSTFLQSVFPALSGDPPNHANHPDAACGHPRYIGHLTACTCVTKKTHPKIADMTAHLIYPSTSPTRRQPRLLPHLTRAKIYLIMPNPRIIRAVFPGAFDPITKGHLDIITRGHVLADELIVAVGHNPEKPALFTPAERVEMIQEILGDLSGVQVQAYEGLTAEFVQSVQANVIIRGIRDNVDLHYELQQANINLAIGGVETVFLMTRDQFALTSSTYIKQIAELGCLDEERLGRLVPPSVAKRLRLKLGH